VPDAASPAFRSGLRSGDVVTKVNGASVEDWESFRAALEAATSGSITVDVQRGDAEAPISFELPAGRSVAALGLDAAYGLVDVVEPETPAAAAGFAPGDLILSVNGRPIGSFASFAEKVRTGGGEPLRLVYARAGERRETEIRPELIATDVGLGIEEPRYRIAIGGAQSLVAGAMTLSRETNPLVSVPMAVTETVKVTRGFIEGFALMLRGEVSHKNLAGPVQIAVIAGNAFERGWETYLWIMVVISINLGIINLLPIPILDGGQAMLFMIEGVKRAPLSLRTREIFAQVGLTLLVMLMGLAFWNDLSRQWSRLLDWLSSSGVS